MLILNLFSPEALCVAKFDGVNVWGGGGGRKLCP